MNRRNFLKLLAPMPFVAPAIVTACGQPKFVPRLPGIFIEFDMTRIISGQVAMPEMTIDCKNRMYADYMKLVSLKKIRKARE